jgi:hypothetical protein
VNAGGVRGERKRVYCCPSRAIGSLGDEQPGISPSDDRFVEAVYRGDTKDFLAFFPKDGVVIDSGRRFAGHDAIRGWSDREFTGAHWRMTVKKVEQKKNVITP